MTEIVTETKTGRGGKKPNPNSKASKSFEIVKADIAEGKSRKDTVFRLMDELGLTLNGASTYYQNAKKSLSAQSAGQ